MPNFSMELHTTPSTYEHPVEFAQGREPYRRVLAVGTPDGLVACDYIGSITTPITVETHEVPEELAQGLGELLERHVAHFDPETPPHTIKPPYWCHNVLEISAGRPLDHVDAQMRAGGLSAEYVHIAPHQPLSAGMHVVVRDAGDHYNVGHSLLALDVSAKGDPEGVSFFGRCGNMGVSTFRDQLEAYVLADCTRELATEPIDFH
jgi:hypothetical protein